jgi:hypothetical protein
MLMINRKDDYRLPSGMQRVGYDADTQTYSYRDADGSYWEGAEGARYGKLRQDMFLCPLSRPPQKPTSKSRRCQVWGQHALVD